MKCKLLTSMILLLIVGSILAVWWFGPWRIRTVLADGSMADGTRYKAVQIYKDFCKTGWVIGIYITDRDGRWKLRCKRQSDIPWRHAAVTRSSEGLLVTVQTESDFFSITQDQLKTKISDELGWSFASSASSSEMCTGLIETTY